MDDSEHHNGKSGRVSSYGQAIDTVADMAGAKQNEMKKRESKHNSELHRPPEIISGEWYNYVMNSTITHVETAIGQSAVLEQFCYKRSDIAEFLVSAGSCAFEKNVDVHQKQFPHLLQHMIGYNCICYISTHQW